MLTEDAGKLIACSKKVAFGTTLPKDIQKLKSGQDYIPPIEPDFPKDLRTKKALFKGITHLR